jgi:hypothetical protein
MRHPVGVSAADWSDWCLLRRFGWTELESLTASVTESCAEPSAGLKSIASGIHGRPQRQLLQQERNMRRVAYSVLLQSMRKGQLTILAWRERAPALLREAACLGTEPRRRVTIGTLSDPEVALKARTSLVKAPRRDRRRGLIYTTTMAGFKLGSHFYRGPRIVKLHEGLTRAYADD